MADRIHPLDPALRDCEKSMPDVAAQLAAWRKLAGKWQSDIDPELEAEQIMAARTPGRKVEL